MDSGMSETYMVLYGTVVFSTRVISNLLDISNKGLLYEY